MAHTFGGRCRERKEEDPELNCVNSILKKEERQAGQEKAEGDPAPWNGREAQEERKSADSR